MKRVIPHSAHICLLCVTLLLGAAADASECYADYKAKQDKPLRLHYGVAAVSGPCSPASAQSQLAPRLSASGWTLLNIVSVFGPDGLNERKQSAGSFYLRF